ncbi:MAG: ferrous iron transport protein B [Magnetospirillum sp. WYHS-4]
MSSTVTVALVGNPNAGVTSLLNCLTGARESVANYPRVTASKVARKVSHRGVEINIVDVPGIYSLSSGAADDRPGCEYLNTEPPDIVVNVLDAGQLDRGLFLTTQLIESGIPRITVLNMKDEARRAGIRIDTQTLASALDSPVLETCAIKDEGVSELLDAIVDYATSSARLPIRLHYDKHLEQAIVRVQEHLEKLHPHELSPAQSRWLAIKLLEGDDEIVRRESNHETLIGEILREREALVHEHDEDPAMMFASARFAFAHGLLSEVRHQDNEPTTSFKMTKALDGIFLHRTLGLPLLLAILWVMFETTFSLGSVPTDWIKAGVEAISQGVESAMPEGMARDLIVNGVIAGVGGTIVFLPNIVILFFFMAVLSGTGYIARASFLMDRLMHGVGLHGTTLIPMVAGFGCNVPAVMATRVITNPRARLIAMLIAPFMNCSARLPVFILFAGAFFAEAAGTVVFGIYMLSIAAAMLSAVLLNRIIPGSGGEAYVMELPPYRLPTLHSVLHHMWDSAQGFIAKVTGVILVGSIVIWFLQEFPRDIAYSQDFETAIAAVEAQPASEENTLALNKLKAVQAQEKLEKSYLGVVSHLVAPVLEPLGFSWRETAAALTGFVAKEVVVATYAVIFAQEKESVDLTKALAAAMSTSTALAFMIFTLLYAPCLATIAVIGRESGRWGWAAFSVGYSFVFAWILALIVRHVGLLIF